MSPARSGAIGASLRNAGWMSPEDRQATTATSVPTVSSWLSMIRRAHCLRLVAGIPGEDRQACVGIHFQKVGGCGGLAGRRRQHQEIDIRRELRRVEIGERTRSTTAACH